MGREAFHRQGWPTRRPFLRNRLRGWRVSWAGRTEAPAGTLPNVPVTPCSFGGAAGGAIGAAVTGTVPKDSVRRTGWAEGGTAVAADAKTGDGGGGGAGERGRRVGCRGEIETVRAIDSSGGAGRSTAGEAGGSLTGGRGATKDNSVRRTGGAFSGLRGSGASAGRGAAAGRYNCVAVYRCNRDSSGDRTWRTIRRMAR